jgi:hypothetical protein
LSEVLTSEEVGEECIFAGAWDMHVRSALELMRIRG